LGDVTYTRRRLEKLKFFGVAIVRIDGIVVECAPETRPRSGRAAHARVAMRYTDGAVIKMYSTRYCGFCVAARRLLGVRGYVFEEIDVSHDQALRHQISKQAGNYRMVPMIFIDDKFIGGYDELAVLDRNGELAARAGAGRLVDDPGPKSSRAT
jgi:glutaredoxin 3